MIHELKTYPEFFKEIWNEKKYFEIRRDDRNFQVGDTLKLLEFDNTDGYTGRYCMVKVMYILRGFQGIKDGYCAMSIKLNLI